MMNSMDLILWDTCYICEAQAFVCQGWPHDKLLPSAQLNRIQRNDYQPRSIHHCWSHIYLAYYRKSYCCLKPETRITSQLIPAIQFVKSCCDYSKRGMIRTTVFKIPITSNYTSSRLPETLSTKLAYLSMLSVFETGPYCLQYPRLWCNR